MKGSIINRFNIVYNAIRTPDGTVLESRNRHDYKTYIDQNAIMYMVDGGCDYLRRNGHPSDVMYEELSLYEDDPITAIRKVWNWGTLGKYGDQPSRRVLLKDMTHGHLCAMLEQEIYSHVHSILERELFYRKHQQEQDYVQTESTE